MLLVKNRGGNKIWSRLGKGIMVLPMHCDHNEDEHVPQSAMINTILRWLIQDRYC